ncbi:sensory box protein [Oleiphilus messinensis]|uniref:histidine kinase n=1 Tax=Oleiphilus messinensis TaxID=141451 RepID=A0A1Y0IHF2_9GAMM|nr:response regulator [Oleiphilus messinensis]ARU58804.1 sensory box protein [Oleiphilus messinensis]
MEKLEFPLSQLLGVLAGVLAATLGGLVVVGFFGLSLGVLPLNPGNFPLSFNTALLLLCCGLGVVGQAFRAQQISLITGSIALVLSSLTLLEHLPWIDLGIDSILFELAPQETNPVTAQMALPSILCFLFTGIVLLSRESWIRGWVAVPYRDIMIKSIGGVVIAGAFVSFVFALGKGALGSGDASLVPMTMYNALGQLLLGIGILTLNRFDNSEMSRFPKVTVFTAIISASLVVVFWYGLKEQESQQIKRELALNLDHVKHEFERQIAAQLRALRRMADRWDTRGGTPFLEWQRDAQAYVEDIPGIIAVEWVDAGYFVRWVTPYTGNENVQGMYLGFEPRRREALLKAQSNNELTISHTIELAQGGTGFLVYLPLFSTSVGQSPDRFDGFMLAVYGIAGLLDPITRDVLDDGYIIEVSDRDEVVFGGGQGLAEYWSAPVELALNNLVWNARVTLTERKLEATWSHLSSIVLVIGFFISALLSISYHYFSVSRRQSQHLVQEISSREAFEESLLLTKERLELAAEVSNLGIWEWDLNSGELQWNDNMYAIYEPPPELIEKKLLYSFWRSRLHPADSARAERELALSIQRHESWSSEFRLLMDDRRVKFVRATGALKYDNEGNIVKLVGGNLDITAQRMLENRLRELKDEADAANQSKSEFLANMSHEIRTPMNGILGVAELLGRSSLSSQQQDYLAMIQSSAKSLLSILNDILDLSKIEAGKLELEVQEFDIAEVVGNSVKSFAMIAHKKNIHLAIFVSDTVPPNLMGDVVRLNQILLNLVGNAIKFTERGEVAVSVERTGHEQYAITVSDTGIGIAPDKQALIFSAFSQADNSTTRKYGGTGLGLTIVAQLVKLMGGDVTVVSDLGEGATFRLSLPFEAAHHDWVRAPSALTGLRVLLLSRYELDCRWLKTLAETWGCLVTLSQTNTVVGLENEYLLSELDSSDVFVLDMDTIETDVISFLQTLATRCSVIVMASSNLRLPNENELTQFGVQRSIIKPVKASEFQSALVESVKAETVKTYQVAGESGAGSTVVGTDTSDLVAPMRILVVEDNFVNQCLVEDLLEAEGHSVVLASNGEDAVQSFQSAEFDLILMDMQMPVMDGVEATRTIRALGTPLASSIPIVALTANAFVSDRERCLDAGMNDFLTKPIEADNLIETINRFAPVEQSAKRHPM